jgi:hypothetical protein
MIGDREPLGPRPGSGVGGSADRPRGSWHGGRSRVPPVCFVEIDMAHLWIREPAGPSSPDGWSAMPLADDALAIRLTMLVHRAGAEPDVWVLIGSAAVHVNGTSLDTGIRVLRDRDELRVDGHRTFFSTELLPEVVSFPGGGRPTFCPRCKLEIASLSPAVCCPQCSVWHHQAEELPCWTYGEHCTMCDQPSALDAGFRWTPEGL